MRGILFNFIGTPVINFSQGIGPIHSNLVEAYSILKCLQIAREMKVISIIVLGDSTFLFIFIVFVSLTFVRLHHGHVQE